MSSLGSWPRGKFRRVITDPEVGRTEDVVRPTSGPVNVLLYSPGQGPELLKCIPIRGWKNSFSFVAGLIAQIQLHTREILTPENNYPITKKDPKWVQDDLCPSSGVYLLQN